MVYRNPENLPTVNANFSRMRSERILPIPLAPAPGTVVRDPNYRNKTWQNRQTNVNQLARDSVGISESLLQTPMYAINPQGNMSGPSEE
jgi:hypothetical protein